MLGSLTWKGHYWIISYKGDTSGIMPGPLKEVNTALQRKAESVLIDLSRLEHINRIGVKAILETLKLSDVYKVNIFIVSPPPEILRILRLNGLSTTAHVFHDPYAAIKYLDLLSFSRKSIPENVDCLLICQRDLPIAGNIRSTLQDHPSKPVYRILIERELNGVLDALYKEKVDCIILDATLPMVKFDDFVEKLSSETTIPKIPMLVVTNDEHMQKAEFMVRSGAHDIIRIPFNPSELYIRLQLLTSYVRFSKTSYNGGIMRRLVVS